VCIITLFMLFPLLRKGPASVGSFFYMKARLKGLAALMVVDWVMIGRL